MRIDRKFTIEAACQVAGGPRLILQHVLIERVPENAYPWDDRGYNGVAVGSNGYLLGVVPLHLDETDTPGLVHRDVLRTCRRMQNGRLFLELGLDEERASWSAPNLGTVSCQRTAWNHPQDFPKWRHLLTDRWPATYPTLPRTIGLDIRLMAIAARVTGCAGARGFVPQMLTFGASVMSPLLYETIPPKLGEPSIPPFVIVMPLHGAFTNEEMVRAAAALGVESQQTEEALDGGTIGVH